MYKVFEREEIVKRNPEMDERTVNQLIDAFLFLVNMIDNEAGEMGEDVLYYLRQDNAARAIGKQIKLTDDEMNKFLSLNSQCVADLYVPMLYTFEAYQEYIPTLTEDDEAFLKELIEVNEFTEDEDETLDDFINGFYTEDNDELLRDSSFNHYDENGNLKKTMWFD